MKALINSSFWSDKDLEVQTSEVKLAALWLMTSSQTSLLGICAGSARRFAFETGLQEEGLARACKALPKSFQVVGGVIFVKNFIRHQFGTGESLKKNNYFKAMVPLFAAIKDHDLAEAVLAEYPEFEGVGKGFERASQAQGKDRKVKERGEEVQKEGDGDLPPLPDGFPKTEAAALAHIAGGAMADPPPPAYVAMVWQQTAGKSGKDGAGHQITRWANYIAGRWPKEKMEWTAKHSRNGANPSNPPTAAKKSVAPPAPANWRAHYKAETEREHQTLYEKPDDAADWRDLWSSDKETARAVIARSNAEVQT